MTDNLWIKILKENRHMDCKGTSHFTSCCEKKNLNTYDIAGNITHIMFYLQKLLYATFRARFNMLKICCAATLRIKYKCEI